MWNTLHHTVHELNSPVRTCSVLVLVRAYELVDLLSSILEFNPSTSMQVVLAVLGCVSVIAAAPKTASVTEYLERVSDYASSLDLPSNSLNNKSGVSMDGVGGTDHIFVNGNLARVLISTCT